MKIELDSHKGLIIVDPIIELNYTTDYLSTQQFRPVVTLKGDNYEIGHTLPLQPYVDGTWTDLDVDNAITNYFDSINIE